MPKKIMFKKKPKLLTLSGQLIGLGVPVSGVWVVAAGDNGYDMTTQVDQSGNYAFRGITPGDNIWVQFTTTWIGGFVRYMPNSFFSISNIQQDTVAPLIRVMRL